MQTKKNQREQQHASWWTFIFQGTARGEYALAWKEQRVLQTVLEFTVLQLYIITKHFWEAKGACGQQRNKSTSMICRAQPAQHRWVRAGWLMHCLSDRTYPWGHRARKGRAQCGRRGQNFMGGKKEGKNGQVVNFSAVFVEWRKLLSAVAFWEDWEAELLKFGSCGYGLFHKQDAFLPGKWSVVSTYNPLHLTLFCNNFGLCAYELSTSLFPSGKSDF